MSLRTKRFTLPVPVQGVRKDLSPLVAPPDTLTAGENILVWDATIRPRPASSRDYFGQAATAWRQVGPTDGAGEPIGVHSAVSYRTYSGSAVATMIAQVGDVYGTASNSLKFMYSEDDGETWSDCVEGTHPGEYPMDKSDDGIVAAFPITKLFAVRSTLGGSNIKFLVACEGASHLGGEITTPGTDGYGRGYRFFWADISNFSVDHTLTWKCSTDALTQMYAPTRGMTVLNTGGFSPPLPPPDKPVPMLTPFNRTATDNGSYDGQIAAQLAGFPGESRDKYCDLDIWTAGKWDEYEADSGNWLSHQATYTESVFGLEAEEGFNWKDFLLSWGHQVGGIMMIKNPDSTQTTWDHLYFDWDPTHGWGLEPTMGDTDNYQEFLPDGAIQVETEIYDATMYVNQNYVDVAHPNAICRYTTDGVLFETHVEGIPSSQIAQLHQCMSYYDEIAVGADIWLGDAEGTAAWDSPVQLEDAPFPPEQLAYVFGHKLTQLVNPTWFLLQVNHLEANSGRIWLVPQADTGAVTEVTEELTGIAQGNMDTEKYAFFSGTTRRLLILDRGENVWIDITRRIVYDTWTQDSGDVYYCTCQTHPGLVWYDGTLGTEQPDKGSLTAEGHWFFDSGALRLYFHSDTVTPPPGNDPDVYYTSPGVEGRFGSILGTFGDNPWVFRFIEKGNDKFVIATNGDQPVAYNDAYDRFRLVGDSDNNNLIDGTESLPPKAFALAVANNRLVLGNLPDISPYAVVFSNPLNFDEGYDNPVLLADTQGSIVSMRELTAITIAVLKEDAIYHGISQVEFMGVSAPMRFELIKAGIQGPCSDSSVVYLPDGRLCWLGRDGGVYAYDGVAPRDMGRHIRHLIQSEIDPERFTEACGMMDPVRNILWFFYPTKDGRNNRGICALTDLGEPWPCFQVAYPNDWAIAAGIQAFFFTDKTYSAFGTPFSGEIYADYPTTAYNAFEGGFFGMTFARKNNSWYTQLWDDSDNTNSYTDFGTPINVLWKHGWMDFGDVLRFDTLHEIHHNWSMPVGEEFAITVESQQYTPDDVKESSQMLYETDYRRRNTFRQTGRKHNLRVIGSIQKIFRWGGAEVLFSSGGYR